MKKIVSGDYDSVLASLRNRILEDNNVTAEDFYPLLDKYITATRGPNVNLRDRASIKAALRKELLSSTGMTMRSFVKFLRLVNIPQVSMHVDLHHHNGSITRHSETFNLSDLNPEENDVDT